MWTNTNTDLETRVVILEAALAWVRHEARSATATRLSDPKVMERIGAIASQVLEDDALTLIRMRRYNAEVERRAG
jgi:hypothetical protein